jgi:Pvc16 N-terminal domain
LLSPHRRRQTFGSRRRCRDGDARIIGGVAGYQALAATGLSIVALLNRRFDEIPEAAALNAFLASSNELKTMRDNNGQLIQQPAISVYCYRISVDRETRPGLSAVASVDGVPRLPLRMHFLLAAWAPNVVDELRWLGLAARVLEGDSILTGPLLDPTGQWRPGDAVQIVTDDLALDSMSETFQALTAEFRLTLPYIARVICIDGQLESIGEPVASVADRLERVG